MEWNVIEIPKDQIIRIRVTRAEKKYLQEKAEKEKRTMSGYIRNKLFRNMK